MCVFVCGVLCDVVWFVVVLLPMLLFLCWCVCLKCRCVLFVFDCAKLHGVACLLLLFLLCVLVCELCLMCCTVYLHCEVFVVLVCALPGRLWLYVVCVFLLVLCVCDVCDWV